uniref:Tail protein n=1 Tax=viral metagenome TaxID=1070528 RepID=A0A6M3K286_9ZZZZ
MLHSPADILNHYLVEQGLFTDPVSSSLWPLFVSDLPDDNHIEDDTACVYDTTGIKDGRIMRGGDTVQHFGIMVMVRSVEYSDGFLKAESVRVALDEIDHVSVTIDVAEYSIDNASSAGPVIALGNEEGTGRRKLFTVNALLTISEV